MAFKNVIVGKATHLVNHRGCVAAAGVVVCALLVSACGQRGSLYLPTEAAARNRATLPQTLMPSDEVPKAPSSTAPSSTAPASSITSPGLTPPAAPSSAGR